MFRSLLLAAALSAATATVAVAQQPPITVVAIQNLQFGTVEPGFTVTVTPTDVVARGELLFGGGGAADVVFQLPSSLTADSANVPAIPLFFGPSSAAFTGNAGALNYFDPNTPTRIRIGPSGTSVYLGGVIAVPATQIAGNYRGEIVVIVSRPNT